MIQSFIELYESLYNSHAHVENITSHEFEKLDKIAGILQIFE